ncbi:Protein FD [Glycine soja]|uniref:Protein FD n=1 Tax=Glycine soja TaxID=3848 RepID=A0A0B2RLU5_GLYSO|nr:Protein FD [Glycine soja]
MEDVWEGINLTSLSDHNTNTNTSKGANFQDFLSSPFTNFSTIASDPSPPVTARTLSTRSEFHFDSATHKDLQLGQPHHKNGSKVEPFGNPFGNIRILPSGDMRKARLIKNRESAAYLFELKQKIKHLEEENARLRRQQLANLLLNSGKVKREESRKKKEKKSYMGFSLGSKIVVVEENPI